MDSHFAFHSGRKIISGYFVTLYECGIRVSESKNQYVNGEEEKIFKWKDYVDFFLEPIKKRFKEGLLAPSNNESNNFGSFEKQFMDFKPFEQQERELEKVEETKEKKLNIQDLMKLSCQEYYLGKKAETTIEKKEENHEGNEEDEEFNFNEFNGIDSTTGNPLSPKPEPSEKHEFYDNNYWPTGIIVDEVALEELMRDI